MKKFFLFTILTILANTYTKEPVQGALYAEIRATPRNGWVRIYKGASCRHYSIKHRFSNIKYAWTPTICFFDEYGRELSRERIDNWSSQNINTIISAIESRLTQLAEADHAKVVWIKGPGYKSVKLFDKTGALIAQTDHDGLLYGHLEVGDALPEAAIEILKQYVSNPDILYSLKITDVTNETHLLYLRK